jgi:hypothetical protein
VKPLDVISVPTCDDWADAAVAGKRQSSELIHAQAMSCDLAVLAPQEMMQIPSISPVRSTFTAVLDEIFDPVILMR